MSNVYLQYILMSTWYVKFLQQLPYTEQKEACLILIYISLQTILRAVCLMSLSLTENK